LKSPKTLAIVIGAFALVLVGFLFFRSPKPIIEIKAETITDIGPFPLVNTYVTSLTVVIVLAIVALLATRKIELIPRGLQNVVEAVMEAFYNICVNTAGEKNGRRFFPIVMTIFTFIWIANWMALLPFFNVIGTVEKVNAESSRARPSSSATPPASASSTEPEVARLRQGQDQDHLRLVRDAEARRGRRRSRQAARELHRRPARPRHRHRARQQGAHGERRRRLPRRARRDGVRRVPRPRV
jgi:hypothetical protein